MLKGLKSKVIILENGKCAWRKCIFCVLSKKRRFYNKTEKQLKEEFLRKIKNVEKEGIEVVKIYNSGSFIDDNQIPREVRKFIFDELKKRNIKKVVIETWPPFVTEKKMKELKKDSEGLEVYLALGLESANNEVLKIINKGITKEIFLRAVNIAKKYGFKIRTYVMVNLPGVRDVKDDFKNTMEFALKYSDSIAIMNTFAYSGYAELFDWWLEGRWKPITLKEFYRIVGEYKYHPKVEIYGKDYVIYPHFPKEYKEKAKNELKGAKISNLIHPYYNIWQEYISYFYEKPAIKRYALFLHCSYKKPYSSSKTHRKILSYLVRSPYYAKIHQLIISNPGVIPREFENKYPFNAYDWPEYEETEEIKKAYIEINAKRIEEYLNNKDYDIIFAYLKPESESLRALEIAINDLGLKDKYFYVLDRKRYESIKSLKGAYCDDILLQNMIEKINEKIKRYEK